METRQIVNFYELEDKWQAEAINNLGPDSEEAHYLEPLEGQTPDKHILWDLTEAMAYNGEHEGFKYNAVITISNNSAMLLNIDDFESDAYIKFV